MRALGSLFPRCRLEQGWSRYLGRGETAVPRGAASQEGCHFRRPERGARVPSRVCNPAPLSLFPRSFVLAMAELIQKKLQGEVEKYQQLQKGRGTGLSRFSHYPKPYKMRPAPLHPTRAPSPPPWCSRPCRSISHQDGRDWVAYLMSLIKSSLSPARLE